MRHFLAIPNRASVGVWCGGIDANAEQVRSGMAWVFDRYVKDRSLYPLQERAQAQRLGLWVDVKPMPPWEWRAARAEQEYRAGKWLVVVLD